MPVMRRPSHHATAQSFGGMLYDKRYDLEPAVRDLDVDIKDVQRVYARLGSTCQAPVTGSTPARP